MPSKIGKQEAPRQIARGFFVFYHSRWYNTNTVTSKHQKGNSMALTLTLETETRLRTVAEGRGMDPNKLHEDLLRQAVTDAETQSPKTLVQGSPEWEQKLWSLGKNSHGTALSLEATSREVIYEDTAL
jgi:hypothetical protein